MRRHNSRYRSRGPAPDSPGQHHQRLRACVLLGAILFSRSGKPGRRRIDPAHIAFIHRISWDHPEWGENRIANELRLKLAVQHSASTIRRYMVRRPKLGDGKTWRIFIRNHAKQVFACDFLVQYTALFALVYIFVAMEMGRGCAFLATRQRRNLRPIRRTPAATTARARRKRSMRSLRRIPRRRRRAAGSRRTPDP